MRPISVEFQAFGPYKGREFVDFAELSSKGLFLICGETGSGKTMILDAITYALYGESSGAGRDDFQAARCKYSEWGTDTYVDFKFEVNGRIYRFERVLECKRSKLSLKHNVYVLNENDIFVPMFENCKASDMENKAKELIGLDKEQFRQVVLLPQGQFEKLLTADPKQKEQVLVNIFGAEKWKQIAEYVYRMADENKEKIKELNSQIKTRLLDEKCDSVEEFSESISKLEDELRVLTASYERENYDEQKMHLEAFKKYIIQEEEAKKEYDLRLANEKAMRQKSLMASEEILNIEKKYNELLEEKPVYDKLNADNIRYEDKRVYYEQYTELKKNYADEQKKLNIHENGLELKERVLSAEKSKHSDMALDIKLISEEYAKYMTAYVEGIVGGLAKELEEGRPCPVCGSLNHPHKADIVEETVTKAEVEAKKKELDKKEKAFEKQKDIVENLEKEIIVLEKQKNEQLNRVELAKKELEHAGGQLLENISSVGELDRIIEANVLKIENYDGEVKNAFDMLVKKKQVCADLEGNLKNISEEIEKAFEKHKTAFENLKRAEALENIDIGLCETRLCEIEKKQKQYTEQKTMYKVLLESKKEKLAKLIPMQEEYEVGWKQAEDDWAFAKKLRGDTGIGLQRYVLGIMFSSVIAAANKMLEKVHGGRYRLYRSDEKAAGSNKKGLELFVYDSFLSTGEGRSVKTLSGGEKFLVSLALSIGLSTVARRSGVNFDAMFIDEGFGSLDENSIEDAMDILSGIQKANGVVGIISHVQLLKDNIPTKLEILKSKDGSRIICH